MTIHISQFSVEVWAPLAPAPPPPTPPGVSTVRFDERQPGEEFEITWYLVAQVSDSGDELRAKTVTGAHVTGKTTAANIKVYGYEPTEPISITDLENGTNSITGPMALPDTDEVTRSERYPTNVDNAMLHTIRVEGVWDGQGIPDRIDEVVYELTDHGARI